MTRFLLAAAVAVALLFAGQARSAEPAVCPDVEQSIGHVIHDGLVHYPDLIIKKFDGAQAQSGIAIFNKLPPAGDEAGDTFYIGFNPQSPEAWLAVVKGDCLVTNVMVPRKLAAMIYMNIQKGLPAS